MFRRFNFSQLEIRAAGLNVTSLAAQPAELFALVEGALMTLSLCASSAIGAVHVVGLDARVAEIAMPVRLAVYRGTLSTRIAVKILLGGITVALLTVLIALLQWQP